MQSSSSLHSNVAVFERAVTLAELGDFVLVMYLHFCRDRLHQLYQSYQKLLVLLSRTVNDRYAKHQPSLQQEVIRMLFISAELKKLEVLQQTSCP